MAYFMSKGISINSLTLSNSTPLHWCAFVGAELSTSYVLAWGGDVNSMDNAGKTPLHLAVKNYQNEGSIKVIKQLLIKGADKKIRDLKGKIALDYLPQNESDNKMAKIRSVLEQEWSIKADFLMVKPAFKKQTRSSSTMLLYFTLMLTSYTCLWSSVYYILYQNSRTASLLENNILFIASLLLAAAVNLTEPGSLERKDNFDFVEML
jgi:Ankyrin repeats (3 copies)